MTMDGPGTRIVQLIDLTDTRSNPDGKLTRNEQVVERGEMCYFASPYDLPAYVRFWRRLTNKTVGKNASMDNHGTTMEVDCHWKDLLSRSAWYLHQDRKTYSQELHS